MVYNIIVGRTEGDRKRLGEKGTLFLGRHYVKMGQNVSLSSNIYLDAARTHVILVTGKRGSGKCLHEDSLITMGDGSLKPIKELANDNNQIVALNEQLKSCKVLKTEFFQREVDTLIYLKLRSGKEIKLTQEHPLLTIAGWKPTSDLSLGSRIAVPRNMEVFGKNELPEHEIKLLSYLLAEGHTKKIVLFANSDSEIVNDFKNSLKTFDPSLKLIEEKKGHYRISCPSWKNKVLKCGVKNINGKFLKGYKNVYEKRSIRKLIEREELYGLLAPQKYISQNILKLRKEQMSLFLNRLFSCDGSIYKSRKGKSHFWEISYSSSSKKLADQVQHLLLRFGILSKLRKKKIRNNGKIFYSYELVIGELNVSKFIGQIGFFGKKKIRQEKALKEIIDSKKIRNPNVDTIPNEIWEIYRPKNWADIGRYMGYKHPKAMRERIHYSPSRETLLQMAECEQNNPLMLLANSDIFWDEIVEMRLLEGKFKVYDISVPELHNFVANDIFVHNSYSLSVIAEEICNLPEDVSQNLSVVIFDTMGIFWTMKYPNYKDENLLKTWNLKPEKLENIDVWIPEGYFKEYKDKGVLGDKKLSIKTSELDAGDWANVFNVNLMDPIGILIENVIGDLIKKKIDYDIEDIIKEIQKNKTSEKNVKDAAINRFLAAGSWGVFKKKGIEIKDIVQKGRVSVLDISCYTHIAGSWGIKTLVTGLICKKLLLERMISRKLEERKSIESGGGLFEFDKEEDKEEMPLVWLMLDECLPYNAEVITSKAHTPIGKIIKKIENGEKIDVWAYNEKTKEYGYFPVEGVYKKGKRKIVKLITETGREIKCTPNHRVLNYNGFNYATLSENIGVPAVSHYDQNKNSIIARLLGHIYGDGWLSVNKTVGFSGNGNDLDLNKIKEDLISLNYTSSKIYSRKTKSKITNHLGKTCEVNGTSQSISGSRNLFKFLNDLTEFSGNKIIQPIKVPKCILNGSEREKIEFLSALFGSDGQSPSVDKNIKSDFNPIRLSFNKLKDLEKEGYEYGNQILNLLKELNISAKLSTRKGNIRKNGDVTMKFVITLDKNIDNIIKFLERIGYRYCEKKEINGNKWLSYLKFKKNERLKREKLMQKAREIHEKERIGKCKIAKMLGIKEYEAREWIYYNNKTWLPKNFIGFEEWIKKRYKDKTIFEKVVLKENIGEEEVFDIAVADAHTFVSNGCVVHNCHEFLPREGKTGASDALIQLLREGRQPGISMVLATQQPGEIHRDVITQSDIVLSHRLTARKDVVALNNIMQTYLTADIQKYLANLPRMAGAAIILDDNSERIYPMNVRPKKTWHGGEAPTAVKLKSKELLDLGLEF